MGDVSKHRMSTGETAVPPEAEEPVLRRSLEDEPMEFSYNPVDVPFNHNDDSGTSQNAIVTLEEATNGNASLMMTDHPIPPCKYRSMTEFTEEFWKEKKQKMSEIQEIDMLNKTKNMSVPMARVKKIMRIDDDVRNLMIASDAPIFMAQAAEFFIEEMTGMGWQFVSESRRRILQKADVASAVHKSDQFDFLIDFLPPKSQNPPNGLGPSSAYLQNGEKRSPMIGMPGVSRFPEESKQNQTAGPSNSTTKQPSFETPQKDLYTLSKVRKVNEGFHCAVNETAQGREYQITQVHPSTSSAHTASGGRNFAGRTLPTLPKTERSGSMPPPKE
ncbi:unnamed protein product [Caenorhabditis sp. 36 PRJEB53466]|nr:unnamed protein product [Caenorhabditis sp. 36 PRJEB53466]